MSFYAVNIFTPKTKCYAFSSSSFILFRKFFPPREHQKIILGTRIIQKLTGSSSTQENQVISYDYLFPCEDIDFPTTEFD